jgi:uncharacterized protein YkwD
MASPAMAKCVIPTNAAAQIRETRGQINAYRAQAGLPALTQNTKLAAAAASHACDMADMGKISHSGSNGSDFAHRIKTRGYKFSAANENVGTFGTGKAAQWWYNSPGHRANMLSPKITEMGLGIALGADKQVYWVMVGGSPR